ncbi:MAG: Tryptophan-rich sensory protein [Oscillospiraceae bacterium]|jgi:translocator protein
MVFSAKKIKIYIFSILLAVGVGALSGFLTRQSMQTFQSLKKPALTPPAAVFPIVWTVLFFLMGIGAAMIYLEDSPNSRRALTFYGIQLAVNFFWTIFFFNLMAYWFSFFWLLLLIVLIIAMIASFKSINRTAAFLQLPYLVWVAFAGYLNFMIALLN